jgi:anti-anti-sigma factor
MTASSPQVETHADATIVRFSGEYDALDEKRLADAERTLLQAVEGAVRPLVVIDLAATRYMGSAFIELLSRAWQRICHRQGQMVLCGVQPFCADVLRAAGLDRLWPSHADCKAALAAMGQSI